MDNHSGFIGFPSVGKSTLMSKLTGQHSEGLLQATARLVPSTDNYDSCGLRVHHPYHCARTSDV